MRGLQCTVRICSTRTTSCDPMCHTHVADEDLNFTTQDLLHHVHPKPVETAPLGSFLRQAPPSMSFTVHRPLALDETSLPPRGHSVQRWYTLSSSDVCESPSRQRHALAEPRFEPCLEHSSPANFLQANASTGDQDQHNNVYDVQLPIEWPAIRTFEWHART